MTCRSESEKRTVVDLSSSFFITVDFASERLARRCVRTLRTPGDSLEISHRYLAAKNFSEHGVVIRNLMYKVSDCAKDSSLPHQ
jgi:hypothetical protein